MNIAEKLKGIPKDTRLYSPMFGDVFLVLASGDFISVHTENPNHTYRFNEEGKYSRHGECMLFPSKDNRDWSNYKLFKAGDFIVREYVGNKYIGILSQFSENAANCYCSYHCNSHTLTIKSYISLGDYNECRLATDEEKVLLLGVINKKGYVWNECALSIDRIHKFDINTFNPFDRVLARHGSSYKWTTDFFSYLYDNRHKFVCSSNVYQECVPYNDETKHLVGTDKECPEYYKTW